LSKKNESHSLRHKIISKPLGFVAFLKVPINSSELGLRSRERLADDAHEPVLQILKKQNRELSYASERREKPVMSSNIW
jgi:hypothetical protein